MDTNEHERRCAPTRKATKPEFELCGLIIGCFYAVYRELGWGFLESVCRRSLRIELESRGIRCESEVLMPALYKDMHVGDFRIDLLVEQQVVVELKAVREIAREHRAQTLNYLRLSHRPVALLLNFGPKPQFERLVGPAAKNDSC